MFVWVYSYLGVRSFMRFIYNCFYIQEYDQKVFLTNRSYTCINDGLSTSIPAESFLNAGAIW
uniref:Putative ovule protein n=1 Tax=Solanum chacoense TaxID=4108 RepID=A0A0V0GUE3_SOLCH